MSSAPVRLGVVGCGNVLSAYRAAIERLRMRGWVDVIAACGRPHQRDAAVELGAQRFTTEDREVTGAADVDLVVVLTPPASHGRLAIAALEEGKHVLLEKPLSTSLDEAKALVQMARRGPGLLLTAPFTPLSPTFQTIARHIRRGDIGTPCSARARYGWSGPWWSEWFYKPGGGCLFDLGVYSIASLTGLLGPARRVMAMTSVALPDRQVADRTVRVEVEDNAQVIIELGSGALAVITTGFTLQQYRSPALEVYGSTGAVQMLGDDWDPEGYELWRNDAGAWQVFKETAPDWPWTDGLRHLVECIRDGTKPCLTPEHAYHVLEVLLAAQRSGKERQSIDVTSSFDPLNLGDAGPTEAAHLVHDRTREHSPPAAGATGAGSD
ncbi:MAG TPA: Gfo/Idh/MocA family oxidoreductase [Planctomycetota bacterium]|nr:Gfo/Idh/MocA family oxidoreductase [Planctomycetota bacterium]